MSGKSPAVPFTFGLWLMARDMRIPVWLMDTDDPHISEWVLRSLTYWDLDKQAVKRSD